MIIQLFKFLRARYFTWEQCDYQAPYYVRRKLIAYDCCVKTKYHFGAHWPYSPPKVNPYKKHKYKAPAWFRPGKDPHP